MSGGDQLNWASADWGCASAYGGSDIRFACRFGNYSLMRDPNSPGGSTLTPVLDPALWIADTPAFYDSRSNFLSCRVPAIPLSSAFGGGSGGGDIITNVWLIGMETADLLYGTNATVYN